VVKECRAGGTGDCELLTAEKILLYIFKSSIAMGVRRLLAVILLFRKL
jgi:hypothetical protein